MEIYLSNPAAWSQNFVWRRILQKASAGKYDPIAQHYLKARNNYTLSEHWMALVLVYYTLMFG